MSQNVSLKKQNFRRASNFSGPKNSYLTTKNTMHRYAYEASNLVSWLKKSLLTTVKSNNKNENTYILPEGTILFHSSTMSDFDIKKLKDDRITFFGIDVSISLWYLTEMYTDFKGRFFTENQKKKGIGYLYVFKTTRPLPVHLLYDIQNHPFGDEKCRTEVCIHPQHAPHESNIVSTKNGIIDRSIEVTMNLKYFNDAIELIHKYEVDIRTLLDHAYEPEFDPTTAILNNNHESISKGGSKRWKKKLNKTRRIRKLRKN